ncbi:MAG: type IV pilus assembly protein PilM [Candidatus Nealsonbacteria bacterium]|nr:MAG: type IV pilus assembly protein PilM [Candidatus Nealsonbacteria bacterium]
MLWTPLEIIPKKSLGIDIGTSSIKIVELSRRGERRKLENYGEIAASVLYQKPFRTFDKSTLLLSSQDVSRAIKAVMEEAKIKTRQTVFSIPDFSSFFTSFELPPMTKAELPQAVRYEASHHVPLPLAEVTLDWQVTEGRVSNQKTKLKILLVTVPNEVINQYREIAEIAQLKLLSLEAEVFGLLRSLIREEKKAVLLVDIGAQSTTCSIAEKGRLKMSYSFDMSGNELTKVISKGLGVDYKTAENLKEKYGIISTSPSDDIHPSPSPAPEVRQILLPLVDVILKEIEKISQNFYQTEGKEIQKIILAGASALLPGLKEYFQNHFKKEIEIANPFSNVFYPPILEKTLKEMGSSYAIAVGIALRGLE